MSLSAKFFWIMMITIIILMAVVMIITLGRRVTNSPSETAKTAKTINLKDFNRPSTAVRYEEIDSVEANEDHYLTRIEVGYNYRYIRVTRGYDGATVGEKNYSNNPTAYKDFMYALHNANFAGLNKDFTGKDDYAGICPYGKRYTYSVIDGANVVQSTWNTSCEKIAGTSSAVNATVFLLFRKQIPDYSRIINSSRSR